MYCRWISLAESATDKPELYARALWGLVVLLVAMFLAFAVMRLIRMCWARADRRAIAQQEQIDPDTRDAWTESARRMPMQADEADPDESDR